jgi:alpha-ketoglutarate-dependent taurine dioxygenase
MSVMTTKLTPHIGVEITGVSGRDLVDPDAAKACVAALGEQAVVVYPEIHIADADLVAFTRLLGETVVVPTGEHELPEIQVITMDPEKGNKYLIPIRTANFLWHFDGAHDVLPQKATLLSAQEVDDAGGGDTEFASTLAAYEALPESEKAQLEELEVVHSFAAAVSRVFPDASEKERAAWARQPPRVHPLVWRHWSGRRSLLLGSTADEIVGWPRDEGRDLLERLLEWVTQPQFVLRHRWRKGDLVIWDNTGALHRATPFEATSPRLLHRTTLAGEAPAA